MQLTNTDLRWYRDKYLAIVAAACFVGAAVHLAHWPLLPHDLVRGLSFLAITALCLIVSPQRLAILLGALAIVALRGIIGSVLYRSLSALIAGLLTGAVFYAVTVVAVKAGWRLSLSYKINEYSYAELAIDTFVLLSLLWAYLRIAP